MTLVYSRRSMRSWWVLFVALIMASSNVVTQQARAQSLPPPPSGAGIAGPQWYPLAQQKLDLRLLAFDPKNPNIVFGGGLSGIFKSNNGGVSWQPINKGLTNLNVNTLAIDPVTTTNIYAGTAEGGVFKSVDGGNNWVVKNNGIHPTNLFTLTLPAIASIAIKPSNPSILYAATNGRGLLYSNDSAESWNPVVGVPDYSVSFVKINTAAENRIYAGKYRSVDSGATWFAPAEINFLAAASSFAISPSNPDIIVASTYAGIFSSTDAGANWTPPKEIAGAYALTFDPTNPNWIYAATPSGLTRSTDGGNTWGDVASGNYAAAFKYINLVAISPSPANTLFIGSSYSGLLRSMDQGANWTTVNAGLSLSGSGTTFYSIAPSETNYRYAGIINGYGYPAEINLFASANGGRTWTSISDGLNRPIPQKGLCGFAINPQSPLTIYATTQLGIQRSFDGGTTWNQIYAGTPDDGFSSINIDPQDPSTIYANLGIGISKSADNGQTWKSILDKPNIRSLGISPLNSNRIYAAGYGFVLYSPDGGDSWSNIPVHIPGLFGEPTISSFVFDPVSTDLIYAGSDHGVFVSLDAGQSWIRSSGVDAYLRIAMLAQDPAKSQTLYAATDHGIYYTNDGFATATKINRGLPEGSFSGILINPANTSILYATIDYGSIYTTDPAAAGGAPTPVSGWWWNPAEPGRGYGLEVSDTGAMRLGLFGFDDSGFSHWWTASGTLDDSGNFTSSLIDAEFGNPLGAPQRNAKTTSVGSVSFAALTDATGTLTLPNGSQVPIQRYEFTPGGLGAAPDAAAPKTGWWTSPIAPGQYFFIEVQNGAINASALSFDIDGGPVWYSDQTSVVAAGVYGGAWQEFIGGQTLSSAYRAPKVLSNAAAAGLRFSSPTSGSLIFGTTILPITWTGP